MTEFSSPTLPSSSPFLPTSKAVNISSEENSVRTVVGGPLCQSGLPFGHTVITGDRHGSIHLKSAISGNIRKKLATTYHGHPPGVNGGGMCDGSLPTCGETVSVSVAEVILTGDDGSPTLWLGCMDGSVQVYFLGGGGTNNHRSQNTPTRRHTRRNSPSNISDSPSATTTMNLLLGGGGGGQQQQDNNNDDQSHHCSHCGSPSRTPPRKRSPVQQQQKRYADAFSSSPSLSNRTGGKAFSGYVSSPQNTSTTARAAAAAATNKKKNSSSTIAGNSTNLHQQKASSSSFLHTPAEAANTISQDGCVLIFAEKKHSAAVQCFVNAPSIDSAFTGGADWSIVRWRTSFPFGVVAIIGRHSRSVRSLAFSPGTPSILLSGGDDGVIKLWSSRARRATELSGHRGAVLHLEPWYDPVGLYGDVFTMLGSQVGGGGTVISATSPLGSHNNNNNNSASNATSTSYQQQQQQQKAIGLFSCGEDGTLRLWSADSQVANCVLQVSKTPVVKAQVFSENLIMAFSKDGAASVYSVINFPNEASCIYRFENVGQIHKSLLESRRRSPHNNKNNKTSSKNLTTTTTDHYSSYLHDVKVLAHLNGFLIWSLTSSGAKLSLLPLNHFESVTKKQLTTVVEKREYLEQLLSDTLDDTDSNQGGGQLLFQKIIAAGGDQQNQSTLLQLAKLVEKEQQQQQNSNNNNNTSTTQQENNNTGNDPHRGWQFDLPSENDLDQFGDPGQLSATEQTASSLRALVKAVNVALSEMNRLNDEFHFLKTDWQMKSFSKVMEMMKQKNAEFLTREFDALEARRKDILAAEQLMMTRSGSENPLGGGANDTGSIAPSSTSKILPSKPKVNPRKQIADMLQEMFTGKRTPLTTRSSLVQSSSSSLENSSTNNNKNYEIRFTDIEKQLIDGISKSVTGEGAASYIYGYCLAKQQSVDPSFIEAQQEKKLQTKEIASNNEKLESELDSLKKQLQTFKKQSHDQKEKISELEKKMKDSRDSFDKKLQEANQKISEAEAREKQAKKELRAEIARRPTELHYVDEATRKEQFESRQSGTFKSIAPDNDHENNNKNNNNSAPSGDSASTGAPPKITNLSSLSLIVSTDKKMLKKLSNSNKKSGDELGASEKGGTGGDDDSSSTKKKKKSGSKSDEEEVATKKDAAADQVVVSMPGVGSWKGAERRTIATQTKVVKSMSSASQAQLFVPQQQQQEITMNSSPIKQISSSTTTGNKSSSFLMNDPKFFQEQERQKLLAIENQKKSQQQQNQQQFSPSHQIVEDTPVAGWTDDDLALIRDSEKFLGKASLAVADDPYSKLLAEQMINGNDGSTDGENNKNNKNNKNNRDLNKTPKRQVRFEGDESDDEDGTPKEDEDLTQVGDTVTAALSQLRELETMYEVSQRNLVAFEDAAQVEGMSLNDPKIKRDYESLKLEERALVEEMRRLHYLLTCPNSPLPGSSYYHHGQQPTNINSNVEEDEEEESMRFDSSNDRLLSSLKNNINTSLSSAAKSEYDGDKSLMKEFQDLIGKERNRMNDSMFLSNNVTSPRSCVARGGGVNSPANHKKLNNKSSSSPASLSAASSHRAR